MTGQHVPSADSAVVEERKILGYLLNLDHEDGHGKAKFLMSFGFTREDWHVLRDALRRHCTRHLIAKTKESPPYGVNFSVDCALETPDRRNPCIRTVWEVKPQAAPRLITAHPKK